MSPFIEILLTGWAILYLGTAIMLLAAVASACLAHIKKHWSKK